MNALTVNGKQLTLSNTQVSLNYINPNCVFFQSRSVLPAGTYKFIVNIPGAIEVKCVNLPEIGEDTVLPIVNGVAKLVLTSDVNIWNASIWPMYALDSNHYEMYGVYDSSSFELVRIFNEILGYGAPNTFTFYGKNENTQQYEELITVSASQLDLHNSTKTTILAE